MKNIFSNRRGFTIIEIIASLLIISFIGIIVSMGMVQAVNGYIYAKQHTETIQKTHAVLSRLAKELNATASISAPTSTSLQFDSLRVWKDVDHTLKLKSSASDDDILTDNVHDFQLNYYEKHDSPALMFPFPIHKINIVEIKIEIIGANNSIFTFKNRVFLRNVVR